MSSFEWDQQFLDLFDRSTALYGKGARDLDRYFSADDLEFLASIGCQPREFFDFVEDWGDGGSPTPATALLIAAVRRDYFIHVQKGKPSAKCMPEEELPARDATFEGLAWFPRVLQKARNKLRGENCPEIMFCCGGDRRFFRDHGIHPADFLRVVWSAGEDDQKVFDFVMGR